MALFGKLFDKKECAFCGEGIGLLGNRKLEDGNMCKNCAAKLSPWFDERRNSTVEQIGQQLEYREANRQKLADFQATRTLGEDTKVILDENAGVFVVTSARDLISKNPDIIKFSEVTGCNVEVDENREEIEYENADGEMVGYNPPRYEYSYDFWVTIHVRNPYFDEIRFKLNNYSVEVKESSFGQQGFGSQGFGSQGFGSQGMSQNIQNDVKCRHYLQLGEEIKEALTQIRQQVREEVVAAAQPKAAMTCAYCGATTTPDATGRCEYCGGALGM